jgi:NHLM bacteriocin system ABC transporter ATP-binding protein
VTRFLDRPAGSPVPTGDTTHADMGSRIVLDGRRPRLLDHKGHVLRVLSGHVDLFAVIVKGGRSEAARQHLLRIESGEIIPDLPDRVGADGECLQVIAVGGLGTDAQMVPRCACEDAALIHEWIGKLARVVAGTNPSWEIREVEGEGTDDLVADERRRGPARAIVWASVASGSARLMRHEPPYCPGSPPIPLTSGMWIAAGEDGCGLVASDGPPGAELWEALDQLHIRAVCGIHDRVAANAGREMQRLAARGELDHAKALEMFDRLSAVVVPRLAREPSAVDPSDALFAACQVVADALDVTIVRPVGRRPLQQSPEDVVEIARASRLRARQTLLRGEWWTQDAGPLLAWLGEERSPVALVRSRKHYAMTDPRSGARRMVDRSVATELAPEAISFYPTLPARALSFRDLLTFSIRLARGNFIRIPVAVALMGLLSLVTPLITQVLVNSAIPRSELDQITVCAIVLAVTAIGMAAVQTMEGMAMLRLEGLIDWKLQAAVIDRVLRLPASLFREYTVGDFVDRSMGIDSVRRVLTGRTLRGLLAGFTCFFSIFLMLFYDARLALLAIGLSLIRAVVIVGTSAVRLIYESRHFNLHGKVSGFVLQLLAGIGKLRVADATVRALAVWSKQFAEQKRQFIASQRISNALSLVEMSFPTFSTIAIFSVASLTDSALTRDLGSFLAFFAAFGQTMAAIEAWASGVSDSLVAIPQITRVRPLIASATEISEDRKPPGELAGAIELSRLTFRYLPGGPPVLDNVSLRIAAGEYVAIVGPSGSGKSSLFRLLLGFEQPESGAVFYDGKSLETLDTSAVRRQLGVVLQNGKLATGSIYENICGGVRLPLTQAWEAATLAGLDADIKAMPMGMHTVVAEGVNTLSGGQRQRVLIARAIARRPRILLLDEATSSLDNQSQSIVSASLGALNVTRIVIAHRLSTVREADRIVVLVDGKIVQSGTYAELSSVSGTFADFTRRQLL